MKILYVNYLDIKNKESIGVLNKISGQIKGLRKNGNEVSYTFCENDDYIFCDEDGQKVKIGNLKDKINKRYVVYGKKLIDIIIKKNINTVYVRYSLSDPIFLRFLKRLNSLNIKVYIEIPTYPYDKEINKKLLLVDKFYRSRLKTYVENIIISSDNLNSVFGVKTIFIDNGIDVDSIQFLDKSKHCEAKKINMIAVSFLRYSNGYDRLINGMKNYYSKELREYEIRLKLIGNGPELETLKEKVDQYKLHNYVEFEGILNGKNLDDQFKNADIAVGSLGDHRVGIKTKSQLKTREYCARGIPFITSVGDPVFSNNTPFILKLPSNETPIDIEEVIKFHEKLARDDEIAKNMRAYAIKNFDWSSIYKNLK